MAVSYYFYRETYKGDSFTEDDFDEFERLALRAEAKLNEYKRKYTVTAPDENAENMAQCAMVDAWYFFEVKQNEYTASSIGSVSTSQGGIDISTEAQDREIYRCASLYLDIYRGVGKW